MAKVHIYGLELKELIGGEFTDISGAFFTKTTNGFRNYMNIKNSGVHFPYEIICQGQTCNAKFADGKEGSVTYKIHHEFDFDEDSNVW